jgi:hypothetical protein
MLKTWMFSFAEDNKLISSIENTITEPDWKKTMHFHHISGCQGLQTGLQPIVSLYIIYVWVVHLVVSLDITFI